MLENVLEMLEGMGRRTGMYVQPVQIATVHSYLDGLQAGCRLGGLVVSREIYVAAAAARGWKFRAAGIVWHMRDKGFTDEAIIQELIAVQAEAFRRAAAGAA